MRFDSLQPRVFLSARVNSIDVPPWCWSSGATHGATRRSEDGCRLESFSSMVTSQLAPIPAKAELPRNPLTAAAKSSHARAARILEIGVGALSLLHIGLVVCNAAGEVLDANRVAKEILEGRDGLELSTENTLCATHQGGETITEMVQYVSEGAHAAQLESRDAILAVGRGAHRRPLTVFVRPSASRTQDAAEVAVLVMILDSALPVKAIELELRQLYGFTLTEAMLANLLMEGKSLEECCEELGILRSTGCTHLRRLFKKTGVHRQSELVGLLLRAIGLAFLGEQKWSYSAARREIQRTSSRLDTSVAPATF